MPEQIKNKIISGMVKPKLADALAVYKAVLQPPVRSAD